MDVHSVEIEIEGTSLSMETGRYARQASGAVVVRQGESMVLVTAVVGDERDIPFLPLTVDYQDRSGAYGRIPGSYFRREGRPNERETLASRVIDRPLRPLFPKHFRREIQVIATAMSFDPDNDTDTMAICGASAALHISEAPFQEPIAGVRVCWLDGEYYINPTRERIDAADLSIVVAGTRDAITMVEGGGEEVSESVLLGALDRAHEVIRTIIDAIEELRRKAGVPKLEVEPPPQPGEDLVRQVRELGLASLQEALATEGKHERSQAMDEAREALAARLTESLGEERQEELETFLPGLWKDLMRTEMRQRIIERGIRLDGRATDEVRTIWGEVGLSTRAHGSAVFTRGETQVFATIALGTEHDFQHLELAYDPDLRRNWMLTYTFPPYCTGEARFLRGPKRREIGHGALAHRSIEPVLPASEDFPYALRSTAEVMESNGSSSMATVCASTLALMDAGVPLRAPVAGIAMGLIVEGDKWAVLSDILGDEDHLGDMDFKVAGTREGITAFQMDVKISGVSRDIMARALTQAREGRFYILDEMARILEEPRDDLSPYAPRITTVHIKTDRIRDIIGPGGKTIRGIQERTNTRVNVDDSGRVDVAATNAEDGAKAVSMIRELTQEAEVGKLYVGVVKRVVDFGAFVEIFPGTDGLIHISHLAKERVDKVTDVLNEGDEVLVRVIDVDRSGKIRLSRKEAIEAAGDL